MAISVVRLGSPRAKGEGIRIGTVRRPPRGVRATDYARLDYYDVWLPQVAPSAELLRSGKRGPVTAARWALFKRRYLKELAQPDNARLILLLVQLSRASDFSIGCYCEDESRCHRSVLARELRAKGAVMAKARK